MASMASCIYLKSPLPSFATVNTYLYCCGLLVCASRPVLYIINHIVQNSFTLFISYTYIISSLHATTGLTPLRRLTASIEKLSLKIHRCIATWDQTRDQTKEMNVAHHQSHALLYRYH